MFETRGYRVSFYVSLILSAVVHLSFLWLIRVDISLEDEMLWHSIGEMRKLFNVATLRRERVFTDKIVVVDIISLEEDREQTVPTVGGEEEKVVSAMEVVEETIEEVVGVWNPFDIDSLDLLLSFPWLSPAGEERPEPRMLIELERIMSYLKVPAAESEGEKEFTLDTKHGKFGISEEGLHLGSLVVPIPLAPYMNAERRAEEGAFEQIHDQSTQQFMGDEDLKGQRERVIEWKRRRERGR
jgi:hypothetical protein